MMTDKVLAFCRENQLLLPGDTVTAAVSGGCDSTALLLLLLELREKLDIRLRAAHFHHGLRGAEADRDEAAVRACCACWDIPLEVGRGEVAVRAQQTRESLEEAARKLRYAFLYSVCQDGKLATAHHADDNAETLLLHLLRGSGLRGLGGIAPMRGKLIRPLLFATHRELAAYLTQKGVSWVEDSSNRENCCVRNRLRHEVLPPLRRENPSISGTLLRTAAVLRQEDAYLSRLAMQALAACRVPDGYDCALLRQTDPVLLHRILLSLLTQQGIADSASVHVRALEALIFSDNPSAHCDLPGCAAARRYDTLLFPSPAPETGFAPTVLCVPGETVLLATGWKITCEFTENSIYFKNSTTIYPLKYDMIAESVLTARARQPKDRLRLSGGSKSVKALMIDRKIPAAARALYPVICCDGQPAAVAGVGVDAAFVPRAGERALLVKIEKGSVSAWEKSTETSTGSC